MSETTTIKVYKYKNIAAALAVLLLIMVWLSTSFGAKISRKREEKANKAVTADSSSAESAETDNGKRLTKSYAYKEFQNGISLNNGLLLQVSSEHPFTGQLTNGEALYSFMFDENGEQVLSASYPSDEGDPNMLKALNFMAADFAKSSGLHTLMVSSMIPEDTASKTDESFIGSSVELMIYDSINGTFDNFTGEDEYVWIPNNCYKYGFVMRGTNKLRYIGREAAALIRFLGASDSSADLEKLQTVIRDYTFEEPMYFSAEDGTEYAAYFVPVEEGTTTTSVPVPTRADESEYPSFISGNSVDGYIVIVNMSITSEAGIQTEVSAAESLAES